MSQLRYQGVLCYFSPDYPGGWSFPGGSVINNLPANAVDMGLIPGSRRSPGERNGNPCKYSCLGNHGQRSLTGYSPWGHKRVRHDLVNKQQKSRWIPSVEIHKSA